MSNFKYEVERLNKMVTELRGQLFEKQAENQKLKLELECVLELLKKAWAGDRIASMHITNILNNAEVNNLKQSGMAASENREALLDKQQRDNILRNRSEYLNHEFVKTASAMNDIPVSSNTAQTLTRPSSSVLQRPRPASSSGPRVLGTVRRAQSAFGGERSKRNPIHHGDRLHGLQANERLELFGFKPSLSMTRYDDPSRYSKDGLFSSHADLKITGRQSGASVTPFVYSQGLLPNKSPRVQANQAVATKKFGRTQPPATLTTPANVRPPPSGILAVQDRPLKNEVNYYEQNDQPQNGEDPVSEKDTSPNVRPKSSTTRGIRFADEVLNAQNVDGSKFDTVSGSSQRPHTASNGIHSRHAAVSIQRRIGISDNAIVIPR